MKKRFLLLLGLGLLVGGLLWRWPYLQLPGEIALCDDYGLYLFSPRGFWGWWRRMTPREMWVWSNDPIAWSPDGQHAAFHCSDGWVKKEVYYRPHKQSVPFDAETMQVRDGLCVLDRANGELRWLIDNYTDHNAIYKTITWTLDGNYIVFESRELGWQRLDPASGVMTPWKEEFPVQDRWYWYTETDIPAEAFQGGNRPEYWSQITTDHRVGGEYSPDRRYILFYSGGGESDPWLHYIYDSHTQQLLYLGTSHHVHSIAWLPALPRW